ncbi:MAG: NlpC/P60 family protein [Patescibacteria group bacterium]
MAQENLERELLGERVRNSELSPLQRGIFEGASDAQMERIGEVGNRSSTLSMLKGKLLERWSSVTDAVEKFNIGDQLKKIDRERNRIARFELLANPRLNKNEGQRKMAEALIAKYKTVENVPAKELLALELASRGTLSKMYAFKETRNEQGETVETPLDVNDIQEGDNIRIDFGRNANADAKLGAGHLLPARIEVVKVIDRDLNVRIGRRATVGGRVGYYDQNGKYLPIYSGFQIRVPTAVELGTPEYAKLGATSAINTDAKALEKREKEEAEAMEKFRKVLEASEASDRATDTVAKLRREVEDQGGASNYRERLEKTLSLAKKHLENKNPEYDEESLKSAIGRLSKTLEILGGKDFGLDLDRYKAAIAKHESGGMSYFARNDDAGRKNGVDPDKWAFGKYQFTVETLRGYGVELGHPPEEGKIQKFLNDALLQEEIMDRYILGTIEKYVLPNEKVMKDIGDGTNSIAYFLALTHIGGPGKLKNAGGKDWLGTDVHGYAMGVSNAYERNLGTAIAQTPRRNRTEAFAERMGREDLISYAETHLGKTYRFGADGNTEIDCSQLVVESMKKAGVVRSDYDNTAAGLFDLTASKSTNEIRRGDLVFLRRGGRITHVEIALGPVENGRIPIIDASSNAGKVTKRYQAVGPTVTAGSPLFVA